MLSTTHNTRVASPTLHYSILFFLVAFVLILAASILFRVEIVSNGEARVVPVGRVQSIQSEFNTKIAAIHIANGDLVEKGQLLISFDRTDAETELIDIKVQIENLHLERARALAFANTLDQMTPDDPGFLATADAELVALASGNDAETANQRKLLASLVDEFLDEIARIVSKRAINRKSLEIAELRLQQTEGALEIEKERLEIAQSLLDRGIGSRADYLDALQIYRETERERMINLEEVAQVQLEERSIEAEYEAIVSNLEADLVLRRMSIEQELSVLMQRRLAAERRVEAMDLVSPSAGIVDQLSVSTIGGIVAAGEELLRVVPVGQDIEIAAFIPNTDVGFVRAGLKARIRIDSYPSERFDHVRGEVAVVAADSSQDATGTWGYVVRIVPERNVLQIGDRMLPLRPGMTGTVDVITGDRRIISYFFAPLIGVLETSLGEQ